MKDGHVNDAAQDVAQDVEQDSAQDVAKDVAKVVAKGVAKDVAEGVLGAAEDGGMKVFIVARAIFQRRDPRPTQACRPHSAFWQLVNSRHVKDAA